MSRPTWKEYEKEIAVVRAQLNERERIAADLHDELGSGLTAIRFLIEIARKKMKENTPVEIERIAQSATEVLDKLNAIIWSMHSASDSLESLVDYIRTYASDYFENSQIECVVNFPAQLPLVELNGDRRRNLSLAIKEILANALKHSNCKLVNIDIGVGEALLIRITDDGKGFNGLPARTFGNGLRNIARRMERIGGHFEWDCIGGTRMMLILPLFTA